MSGSLDADTAEPSPVTGGRIRLAREPAIRLGALVIEPALRRIAHDDGREEIVEPRVMQVLVALVRAAGGIVTRDELLANCWHGVVVGEDAITRVIGRLRRVADGIGGGAFRLETITKVGFRLVRCDDIDRGPSSPRVIDQASAAAPPLLAVLPFDNLCEDIDMTWFSDGVSAEIQQTIARATELRVIGRASSFQFRGADKAAGRVAAALNATHVLDGSVRRSGAKVRISAELIECAGQTSVWSDRFDRDLVDVFSLQDEIAGEVAKALETVFAPSVVTGPIDPAAYDLYLRARGSFTDDGMAEMAMLEKVTALAPTFAPAWALLACIRAWKGRDDSPTGISADDRARIVAGATTALRLDTREGLALAALGAIEPYAQYARREGWLRQATACAPSDAALLSAMTGFCASVGRLKEAFAWAKKAYDIDPFHPSAAHWYANQLFEAGYPERSLEIFEQASLRWPEAEMFIAIPLQFCAFGENWEAFDAIAERVRAAGSPTAKVRDALFVGSALRNPGMEVRSGVLRGLEDTLDRSGTLPLGPLVFAHKLGLGDEVFDLVGRASFGHLFDPESRSPSGWYNAMILFSHITDMSRDPRFLDLCRKLGLCDYWVETNRWPDCAESKGLAFDFKAKARLLVQNTEG